MSSAEPGAPDRPDRALAALRRHERRPPEEAEPSRYERLEELGRGAMGTVHLARDREADRLVALKVLDPGAVTQREALARFRREAEALARLSHPHIVRVLDLLESPPAIVLELVPGRSLADLLEAGALDRGARLTILEQVARAVHHAHTLGVVHRDLKPSNILVTDALEPKVADFGIAQLAGEPSALTASTAFLGTPAYMAPEQAAGTARLVDARTDVHALGVILYELLTGQLPQRGASAAELLLGIIERPPDAPRSLDPTIPRALEAIVLRALAKRPDQRFQTALELADAIAAHRTAAPARRSRPVVGLLVALLLAVAALATALRLRPGPAAPPPPAAVRAEPPAGPDLEARLRAGEPGALEAIAGVASGAELLERLARDAVVLPLERLERLRPHGRCRPPLAALEAVALLASGAPPGEARARLRGAECQGLALALLDAAERVARVRDELDAPGQQLLVGRQGLVAADALAPLARLADRPDLLAAAVAPLASACRSDLLVRMTMGTPALGDALADARWLEPALERLPPAVSVTYVLAASRWELAGPLACAIASRDPFLAGYCAALGFLNRSEDVDGSHAFAEAALGPLANAGGDPLEVGFAQRTLYVVARAVASRALQEASARPAGERDPALEEARMACRAALGRNGSALKGREIMQDAHRLAGVTVLLGDVEGARRVEGLDLEDPLARPLPADREAIEALASGLIEREHTVYVALSLALSLRARARTLRGDREGAAEDAQRQAALGNDDAWLDYALAERLVR